MVDYLRQAQKPVLAHLSGFYLSFPIPFHDRNLILVFKFHLHRDSISSSAVAIGQYSGFHCNFRPSHHEVSVRASLDQFVSASWFAAPYLVILFVFGI